jgi:nucleoid DNA-binding protein
MRVLPEGVFDEAAATVWIERVAGELRAGRRVSLPGLGTLRRKGAHVQFTHAPELWGANGNARLKPAPDWVVELPNLHGAIADALVSGRCTGVDLEGFGMFSVRYEHPAERTHFAGRAPVTVPGHGARWLVFQPSPLLSGGPET